LDFALATLFLILYYVRPHEWLEWMASVQPITKVLAVGLAVVLYQVGRRVHWHPRRFLGEFLRTPLDWILLAFTLWVLHAAADWKATWSLFYPSLGYYVLVQHALSTVRRIESFLWVWLGLLLFIATMAVLSEYNVDTFNSLGYTQGMYKGRLTLNLSIFNNPNALGHSVAMILPMIFFLGIWHRFLLGMELSLPLYIMPVWCLLRTESKGAFVSSAAGLLTTQACGRPRWVQIALLLVTYALGMSALMLLPRMNQLGSVRGDRAVQGRLLSWNFGWESFKTLPKGLGYGEFINRAPVYVEGKYRMRKPAHSSYVEVGAELGKSGLFLWLGILYYSLKSLLRSRGRNDQEERIRRLLVCLVVIYMVSSWLTNISYRGSFFIQTAVIAALCRLRQRRPQPDPALNGSAAAAADGDADSEIRASGLAPLGGLPTAGTPDSAETVEPVADEGPSSWLTWRRLVAFLVDMALIYVMYLLVIRAWLYFMLDWKGV
jgi:hypothetical protein